jgi:hypothetical protein
MYSRTRSPFLSCPHSKLFESSGQRMIPGSHGLGFLHERFHITNECHIYANAFLPILFIPSLVHISPNIQSFFLRPSHVRLAFARDLSSLFLPPAFNTNHGDLCFVGTKQART